ncbi:MAG: hypothetical protein HY985_01435, partial [Magnetospirillum sp.]|nr:hypothetical protein [Magnetospirillum sp.]
MADDDRTQMDNGAPTPDNGGTTDGSADVTTLDALHVDGKGQDRLEDATESELPDTSEAEGDDVAGHANVQSAGRSTFEQMIGDGLKEGPAMPVGDEVDVDVAPPSEPDNNVAAKFENPHPQDTSPVQAQEFGAEADGAAAATIERPQEPVDAPKPDPEGEAEDGGDPDLARQAATTGGATTTAVEAPVAPPPPPLPPEDALPELPPEKVAQAPTVDLFLSDSPEDMNGAVSGDRKMKLNFDIHTNDSDGGTETLTVSLKGVPDDFSFSDADGTPLGTKLSDGTWTFTVPPSDVPDVYLVRPEHYSGDLTFEVTATAHEATGSTTSVTKTATLHIEAIADEPTLLVDDVAGMENTWIPLADKITTQLVDADGSETLAVYIDGVPPGGALNHGTV